MTKKARSIGAMGIIAVAIGLAVGVIAWQKKHLRELAAENEQLRQEAAEVGELRQKAKQGGSNEMDRAELERLRAWQEQTQPELMRLRGMVGSAREATKQAADLRAELARKSSETGTNGAGGAMGGLMKQALEQQLEGRLSRMANRLHLTADQAQAVRGLLTRQSQVAAAGFQQVFMGKGGKEDFESLAKGAGNTEEQIKALLTPEQQAEYAGYQQEEAAGNARLAANAEMIQMQGALGLTTEQQDQVFTALYEVTFNQLNGSPTQAFSNPVDQIQWAFDQKAKALESVLTTAQLEGYRQQQAAQLKFFREAMGRKSDTGGAK